LILSELDVNFCTISASLRHPPGQFPPLKGPLFPGPDFCVNEPLLFTFKHSDPTKPLLDELFATSILAHPLFGPAGIISTLTVADKGCEPGHGPSPVMVAITVIFFHPFTNVDGMERRDAATFSILKNIVCR
jgi:hypothetical protein